MELPGLANYAIFFATFVGVYGILALGLNLQWGLTGQFNIGIAAFFAVGAYASAILTGPPSPEHVGGWGLPFGVGLVGAAAGAGGLALVIGLVTLRLRADYLAIATIGLAELVRLFLKNEGWLTGGVRGIAGIPKPLAGLVQGADALLYLFVVGAVMAAVFLALERLRRAPFGRVLRAIRDNEPAAMAAGKNIVAFRLQAFVVGSAVMGLGGALYAHLVQFISPEAFDPMFATFLIWVMLIAGGSGNNLGAIVGAVVIWLIWSGTQFLTGLLPAEMATQAGALRVLLIGLLLEVVLLTRPEGILGEHRRRRARQAGGKAPR